MTAPRVMNGFFWSVVRGRATTTLTLVVGRAYATLLLSWTSWAGTAPRSWVPPGPASAQPSLFMRTEPSWMMHFISVGTPFRAATWAHSLDMGEA